MSDEKLVENLRNITHLTWFTSGVSLVCLSGIFGIGMIWYYINEKAFQIAKNVSNETLCEMDAKKTV